MLSESMTAPGIPNWTAQVEAGSPDEPGRPMPGVDELEPLAELLRRAEGVRFVVARLRRTRLSVTVGPAAPDANAALARARGLVASCGRSARLGELTIDCVRVTPRHELPDPWTGGLRCA